MAITLPEPGIAVAMFDTANLQLPFIQPLTWQAGA